MARRSFVDGKGNPALFTTPIQPATRARLMEHADKTLASIMERGETRIVIYNEKEIDTVNSSLEAVIASLVAQAGSAVSIQSLLTNFGVSVEAYHAKVAAQAKAEAKAKEKAAKNGKGKGKGGKKTAANTEQPAQPAVAQPAA